eukprot:3543033-Amphidinium_carterae.1
MEIIRIISNLWSFLLEVASLVPVANLSRSQTGVNPFRAPPASNSVCNTPQLDTSMRSQRSELKDVNASAVIG